MGTPPIRRTAAAKRVREAAERAVLERLRAALPADRARSLRRAATSEGAPAWDLEYRDGDGERVAVLVRGTEADGFDAVEVSAAEWAAARRLGTRSWLMLVTDVLGVPRVAAIQNPAGQVQDRTIDAVPTGWRLTWPFRAAD